MRIGSYVIGGYPKPGGVSTAVRGLTHALARKGHDLFVLCQARQDGEAEEGPIRIRTFARPQRAIPFMVSTSLLNYVQTNPDQLDLIVLNGMFNPDLIRLGRVARKASIPYVVASHGPYHPMLMRRHAVRKRIYLQLLERRLLNQSIAVQLLADHHRLHLKELSVEAPTITVPNGMNIAANQLPQIVKSGCESTVFGYLGRIDAWHKGLDLLIDGFASARRRTPESRLVIQGPDWGDKARLQERVTQLGMERSVSFLEPLVGSPITAISKWDVLITPSRWDGAPLTVLEAMFAGRPVIVSSEAGMAEHVRAAGSGVVIEPSSTGIADGITSIISCKPNWKEMAETGRSYALGHSSWETIAEDAARQYAELLK